MPVAANSLNRFTVDARLSAATPIFAASSGSVSAVCHRPASTYCSGSTIETFVAFTGGTGPSRSS
jgi:hypothetical protein